MYIILCVYNAHICVCVSMYAYIILILPHSHHSPRRSSSGDRLSITPDNLSPSPASSPNLLATKGYSYSSSTMEVASATANSNGHRNSVTSYNSSTLPLRRPRNRISTEEKNRKVNIYIRSCVLKGPFCFLTNNKKEKPRNQ